MARVPLGKRLILDLDSSESPVHGEQEGAAYNGHFESVCYHPLFCFNQFGDCEGALLRPGNSPQRRSLEEVLEPVVERYQKKGIRLLFRADAAFAKPDVYEYLESQSIGFAIRLPANEVLQDEIRHLLKRPRGRPPRSPSSGSTTSSIGPRVGTTPAGWSPRWSGTGESCSHGWGSSSPT